MILKRRTTNDERRTFTGLRAAFTMIEVLVAMTVLAILMLMVANIFQGSSASWNIGTQKSDMNTGARAALDFMARELVGAVAGEVEAASLSTPADLPFILSGGNDVQFVALSGDPGSGERALRGACFTYVEGEKSLKYELFTNNNVYSSPFSSGSSPQLLVANVCSLTMLAYADAAALAGPGSPEYNSSGHANRLPLCLDIAIEVLSDEDMARADAGGDAFVDRNAKLYSTRVYFPNRVGYGAR